MLISGSSGELEEEIEVNLDQEATGRTNAKPATQRSRSTNTNLPGKQIFDDGRHTPFGELDTLPRLLQYQASVRSNKTAIRKKEFGIWHTWSWANVAEEVRAFACGLAARGFSQGDNLGIVGDIRARLYWAIVAAQSLGGIAVPLYSEASADEMARVINELGTRFIVVQDQEQVDKLIKIKAQCPSLEGIIYVDPRGMRHYHELYLIKYDDMRSKGREFHVLQPDYFHQQLSSGSGEDVAFVLQTAGTTGTPKSVLLTHNNVLATASSSISELALTDKEQVLAFLPMAMATSILFYLAQPLIAGFCVSYPESDETVLSDLRDIGPTFLFASSHFYKGLHNSVMSQMTGATAIKRYFFHHIMSAPRNAAFSALDNILITGPLKNTLGLSRIRLALTTGDALSPVVQSFYRALGIKLRQFYGPTEGFCLVSLQPDGINERPENVGIAANNVKIDITPQGEVVFKSDTIFRGYHKNTSATISSGSASEWIHTGDAGFFGPEGQLNILGPVVHRRRLASGLELFPQSIERRLKFSPYIRDAVVFGNERA